MLSYIQLISLLISSISYIPNVWSSRVVISGSHNVLVPESLVLQCSVEGLDENEVINEIDWLKNKKIFLRNALNESEQSVKLFPSADSHLGHLNLNKSIGGHLVFDQSAIGNTGCYTCFVTIIRKATNEKLIAKSTFKLKALYIEEDLSKPLIRYHQQIAALTPVAIYRIGEVFAGSCESSGSNPAAIVELRLNGLRFKPEHEEVQHLESLFDDLQDEYPLFRTLYNFTFTLTPWMRKRKYMELECISTVSGIKGFSDIRTSEAIRVLVLDTNQLIDVNENVRKQQFVFYGYAISILVMLAICLGFSKLSNEKPEKDVGDNLSHTSAYDAHYRKASPCDLRTDSNQR
ncbi:hypothetical protein HDE_08218 [Halotydeus destructor]|nr:hypothetical protein HDE_08218 [Halotydeus destructor]